MDAEVKLYMIFDILGDTERTGPLLWYIDRKRLEDIKNHTFDLLLIARIIRKKLPKYVNYDKLYDYIICHDLPEAITGDITKFEGVPDEEIKKVTSVATDYLQEIFGDILDIKSLVTDFENKLTLEAKIASLIDKAHSALTFVKYSAETNIDIDNPKVSEDLRNHPFIIQKRKENKDLGDMFYEFHRLSIKMSPEEVSRYNISLEDANLIVDTILNFLDSMHDAKLKGKLLVDKTKFPKDATIYNRELMDISDK